MTNATSRAGDALTLCGYPPLRYFDGASCQPVLIHAPSFCTNTSVAILRSVRVCPPLCRSILYDV